MKVMSASELESMYGISPDQLDALEDDATCGIFHGEARGKVLVGRPLMFSEEMRQVGFKEPLRKVEAIDKRARELGLRRSDYLRKLVDDDLAIAGIA